MENKQINKQTGKRRFLKDIYLKAQAKVGINPTFSDMKIVTIRKKTCEMNNNNNDNKKYTDEGRQHSEKQKDEICKIRLQFT